MDKINEEYPLTLYRGISQKDWIDENGLVLLSAFQLGSENYGGKISRDDDFSEISINWNDDKGSLENMKTAVKTDKDGKEFSQFEFGFCEIDTIIMKKALMAQIQLGNFSYERAPINDRETGITNQYHGNLLINKNIKTALKRMIQSTLASIAGFVKNWDDEL